MNPRNPVVGSPSPSSLVSIEDLGQSALESLLTTALNLVYFQSIILQVSDWFTNYRSRGWRSDLQNAWAQKMDLEEEPYKSCGGTPLDASREMDQTSMEACGSKRHH